MSMLCVSQCIDASMTVHAKEVYKLVIGMFNATSSDHSSAGYPQENGDFENQFALDIGQFCFSK